MHGLQLEIKDVLVMVMSAMGEEHICALSDIDQKYDKGVRLERQQK